MKRIALFGSTGSIGCQTLDVVRWHPDRFAVQALVARRASAQFWQQVEEFRPAIACVTEEEPRRAAPPGTVLMRGSEVLPEIACDSGSDILLAATSGTVGFASTLAALAAGKPVALANKETLVMAGHLVSRAARTPGAALFPVDSEHSAIWQCLIGEDPYQERVERLLLTASGGAFRDLAPGELEGVTASQALKHPTWTMGPKVTIDSASLMNKGLEVIEAHWLFGIPFQRIQALIHHQSIIHSMVEFFDGSVKAQLGMPDMRLPIQFALAFPERLPAPIERLDLARTGSLTFAEVDLKKYRCLSLAIRAGTSGGSYPTVLNAANEVAVARFLAEEIRIVQIPQLIEDALERHRWVADPTLDEVMEADREARAVSRGWQPPVAAAVAG